MGPGLQRVTLWGQIRPYRLGGWNRTLRKVVSQCRDCQELGTCRLSGLEPWWQPPLTLCDSSAHSPKDGSSLALERQSAGSRQRGFLRRSHRSHSGDDIHLPRLRRLWRILSRPCSGVRAGRTAGPLPGGCPVASCRWPGLHCWLAGFFGSDLRSVRPALRVSCHKDLGP